MKAPLSMPASNVALQSFELVRIDYSAPEASGRIGGVQAGFPLWRGAWSLARMEIADSDTWRAFLASLRGATRRFLGKDYARLYPKLYPNGFADFVGFTGDASSWSETINADDDSELSLDLGASAAGLVLSVGDYVGFRWTATDTSVAGLTWHAVVRVVEGGTADGSGDVTVTVEPPVPPAIPITATAYLNEPKCVMALVSDNSDLDPLDVLKSIQGGTITGVQDIRE